MYSLVTATTIKRYNIFILPVDCLRLFQNVMELYQGWNCWIIVCVFST